MIIFFLAFILFFSCAQMFSVSKVTLLVILRWLDVLMLTYLTNSPNKVKKNIPQ